MKSSYDLSSSFIADEVRLKHLQNICDSIEVGILSLDIPSCHFVIDSVHVP